MTLAAALDYASRGWRVFPVVPRNKVPLTPHGLLEASRDQDQIGTWWARWPDANIGLACGRESGVVALDVDPRHGGDESLEEVQIRIGRLPSGPVNLTGGGGRHFLFRWPGVEVRNQAGVLGLPGLDFRGDGGYIVLPPSIHESGRRYAWDAVTEHMGLPALPGALGGSVAPSRASVAAQPMPDRIPQGQRESILTSLAGSMRRRGAQPRSIEAALAVENLRCEPPLSASAVHRIAWSVGRYSPTFHASVRGGFPE